jgi:Cys-rich protein (TIGR04453 family)
MILSKKEKLILIILLLLITFCKNPIEQECERTCHFAERFAIEAQVKTVPPPKMLEKIHIQCLGSCTMFQQEFLNCKEQSKNSCKEFYECILSAGVFN